MKFLLKIDEASLRDKFPGICNCATCSRMDSGYNCYHYCKDKSAYIPVKKLTNGDVLKAAFPNLESIADLDILQKAFGADWWDAEYTKEKNS